MATELDKLVVKIEADLGDLKKGLNKANNQIKSSSSKMSNSFNQLGNTLDRVGKRVIVFGGLIAGAFGAIQIKKVVDVGRQIEDLQVRLKALFGTAQEGAKAFDVMVKFAGRVPFTLNDIQQASGNLAVVSKDAEELAEILEITGNVAGATGLDFTQTAEQIQRSFAGGIASADVFRERGVRSMLGFQAGAEVSASETIRAFKEKFGKGGEFGNVTNDLANTLTGTLSMLEDKLFQFRKAISDEFTVVLKENFKELNKSFDESSKAIEELGKSIGRKLGDALTFIVDNVEELTTALKGLGLLLTSAVGVAIFNLIKNSNKLALSLTGLILAYNELSGAVEKIQEFDRKAEEQYKRSAKALNLENEELQNVFETFSDYLMVMDSVGKSVAKTNEQFEIIIATENQIKDITDKVGKTFDDAGEDISKAFGKSVIEGEKFGDAMKTIFRDVASEIVATIAQILIIEPMIRSLKESLSGLTGGGSLGIGGVIANVAGAVLGGNLFGGATSTSSVVDGHNITEVTGSLKGLATGGYVAPNVPVMVGERGAEMFMPTGGGHIIPNNQMGGQGVTINQHLNFSTGVVPTVRAEVMNLMPQIKEETVTAVAEARTRGGAFSRAFGA
jgi:DNA anti-recombination protein RmuC